MKFPWIVATVVALYAGTSSPVQSGLASEDADLTGVYSCEGTRPDGAPYRGMVEIVRDEGTYQLRWTLPPDEQYLGIGLVSGDSLSVSFFGGLPGVVVYRIEKGPENPRLVGRWTVIGAKGDVFAETLVRITKDLDQAPSIEPPSAEPPAGQPPAIEPQPERPRRRPGVDSNDAPGRTVARLRSLNARLRATV